MPVRVFLKVINDLEIDKINSVFDVVSAVSNFVEYMQALSDKHSGEQWSKLFLSEKIFSTKEYFKVSDLRGYCKVHLKIGVSQLQVVFDEFKSCLEGDPERAINIIMAYKGVFRDYLFDFKNFVEFLEREKNKDFVFFSGFKSVRTETYRLYSFSKALAYSSTYRENMVSSFHKEAQTASAFVLRQALELKIDRVISVDLRDKNGNRPRLKHGFHYSFMVARPDLFEFVGYDLVVIKNVYDWCSNIVHTGNQPFIWQMPFAYELCSGFFSWGQMGPDGGDSIYGGVRICNVPDMQVAFAEYFAKGYHHGVWCIAAGKPEAADFTIYH
ncbi:hypothetical protein [Pseudomonas gingeri]